MVLLKRTKIEFVLKMAEWRSVTQWDGIALNANSICIIDEVGCDGRSLTNTILSAACKAPDNPVIALISLDRQIGEWVAVGRRMGYDLSLLAIQKRFFAAGGMVETLHTALEVMDQTRCELAITDLLETVGKLSEGRPVLVVLEGLSILPALGWTLGRVMKLIKRIEGLCDRFCARLNRDCTFGMELSRWLSHRCEMTVLTRALSSGKTRQVYGELVVIKGKSIAAALFKCSDSALLVQPKSNDSLDVFL